MLRATPFLAVAAILAVQSIAGVPPVVAFPLYLAVILVVSVQQNRAEALGVGAAAALAILLRATTAGQESELVAAALLATVLVAVAVAMGEVTHRLETAASAERRRLDGAVESERRLRSVLESVDVGIGLADSKGTWVQVNEPLAAMLGCSRDELLRTTLPGVLGDGDRAAVNNAMDSLRAGDVTRWSADVRLLKQDGTAVPAALFLGTVPAADGAVLVQAVDLTVRARADSIREAVGAVRQAMVTSADLDSAMPLILEALRTYLGWSGARYRSTKTGEGLAGRVWKSGMLAAEQTDKRSTVVVPVVDGGEVAGVIELESKTPRTPTDDEVTMLVGIGVEIGQFMRRTQAAQALRRSEADHRAVYERSPIGIARISADGELEEANPALLHILEQDDEAMRTKAWPELLRAYDRAASRSRKASFLAGITDGSSLQVRAATGAGNWLWLQLTATSIADDQGRLEHVLVLVEDVTAVRETSDRLEESLEAQREANANLEKLDRTKSEFLSIVSHEFRTALTGIQGFSELIRDGGLEPDEVRSYGGYIFNDADRVNRLIGDMLDLDRMESGRMTMRTADVDINEVLTEAVSRAAPSAVTVDFKSDLDPRLPIVAGDRDRLIQVVSNLVNNAVKYSPEGGTVTLSSRVEGRYALVSVSDTGIGIPPDEIAHVFERFRRVRSGAAQSIPGTGLGLTIVKQIVEMHGGKIWVESAVGHGSSFHFTIPLAPEGVAAVQLRHA